MSEKERRVELEGKVAVVTGAAMGIGRAIAVALAEAGAMVAATDIAPVDETVRDVERVGGRGMGIVADVTSDGALTNGVDAVQQRFGGIDILVNNAGLFASLQTGPFDKISVEEWRAVMDVNVTGSFLAARAVVGSMRTRGGGRIVNIASTTAFKGVANLLHYVSSKGAILAMTKALARELGPDHILVNAVAPGFTVSAGVEANADHVESMRANAPGSRALSREMAPDDVVGAVRFLAGPMAGFITGQTIVVDGGAYFH